MRGFTTYLIHSATNKKCQIVSYDTNFDNKILSSHKEQYINSDISNEIPLIKNRKPVPLRDDHTSQLERLNFFSKVQYRI